MISHKSWSGLLQVQNDDATSILRKDQQRPTIRAKTAIMRSRWEEITCGTDLQSRALVRILERPQLDPGLSVGDQTATIGSKHYVHAVRGVQLREQAICFDTPNPDAIAGSRGEQVPVGAELRCANRPRSSEAVAFPRRLDLPNAGFALSDTEPQLVSGAEVGTYPSPREAE